MEKQDLENIATGTEVFTPRGVRVGKVVGVHFEPAGGSMASGLGYIEIEDERPEGGRHIHLPLTEVLEVGPDKVVAELDPDIVTSHNKQWIPNKP